VLEYAELESKTGDTDHPSLSSTVYLDLLQASGLHALIINAEDCLVKTFGQLDAYLHYSKALPDMQLSKMLDPSVALQVGSALRELRRTGQAYRIEQAWSPSIVERLNIQLLPSFDDHVILIFKVETVQRNVAPEVQNDYEMALHQLGFVQSELQKTIEENKKLATENDLLHKTKERLELAVRGTNDGIWDWHNINKESIWWSPRFYELLGYSPKELQSTRSVFQTILHPDDTTKCDCQTFDEQNPFSNRDPFKDQA
jgi:PAS domain-containing protein